MKSYLISDNIDTQVGFEIAGIKGTVVHSKEEVINVINQIKNDKEIGLIIMTERISFLITDLVIEMKLSKKGPLIVEIPDRHGSMKAENSIVGYVKEAIGLKI